MFTPTSIRHHCFKQSDSVQEMNGFSICTVNSFTRNVFFNEAFYIKYYNFDNYHMLAIKKHLLGYVMSLLNR